MHLRYNKSFDGSQRWKDRKLSSPKLDIKCSSGLMRSRTPTGSSSRMSMSGRSSQSVQVIARTRYHVVENFGMPLPVLVTEALKFAERSAAVSAHISPDGWAWLVCGRRLLIWQYKQTAEMLRQQRPRSTQCRELTLPPSELAHRADLVWVYTPEGSQVPACIAVSPEGTVRYWPSVAYEGSYVEDATDLQGQECDSLTSVAPLGCILATTTSTIVLLQPQVMGGRHCVTCHTLKPPQSLLGGIGRRMSSLIFGSLPSSGAAEAKLVRVIAVEHHEGMPSQPEYVLFVLTEHSLQKWSVVSNDIERLVFECELRGRVHEAFQKTLWDSMGGNPDDQECWLLDMHAGKDSVTILAASVNQQVSQELQIALVTVNTATAVPPSHLQSFTHLGNTGIRSSALIKNADSHRSMEQEMSQYQLLIAGNSALVYSDCTVLVYPTSNLTEEPDTVKFPNFGDCLLGGAACVNVPVFFSKLHGLVSISPLDYSPNDLMSASMVSQNESFAFGEASVSEACNISTSEQDLEELTTHHDNESRLKAAFLYHVSKNHAQCEAIIREQFPHIELPYSDIDSPMDVAAVKVSRDLIDDIPAKDPRWVEMKTSNVSLSSSTSLQILRQLEQKQQALDLFFNFLCDMKLWPRLTAVSSLGVIMSTTHVLAEQGEKLVAAIAMRQLHGENGPIIDTAIKLALDQKGLKSTGKLSQQDLFYREVTGVHRAIQMMVKWSEEQVHSDRAPSEIARLLAQVNEVILAIVTEVIQYRQQKAEMFEPSPSIDVGICEYLPWTAAPGPNGLRDALLKQQKLTLKYGARNTGDAKLKTQIYDQVVSLVDIILDGRKCHVESVGTSEKSDILLEQYQEDRSALIQPLVEDKEYERATILAEKYCDFRTLVYICDITENKERLENYMEKFSGQNFSQFLFNWYLQEQKPGRLLETFRVGGEKSVTIESAQQQEDLARFLQHHPALSWLQHVFLHDFRQAGNTLCGLAKEETELLRRKKSMLSLGKLALLASDNPTNKRIEWLDSELDLVAYQEDLPDSVLAAYGYDLDRMRVLTPTELIQLYISSENLHCNEFTFKKALDLLEHVEDNFVKSELKHKIWCECILRDTWVNTDTDMALETVQNTVFYKLVLIMDNMGADIKAAVPPLQTLLDAQELESMRDSSSFKYLLTLAYEHLERLVPP